MPHTQRAFDWFDNKIDELRERAGRPVSFLYVGWRHDTKPWWYDTLCKKLLDWDSPERKVAVLDIFPKNIGDLEQLVWSERYDVEPVLGDVMHLDETFEENEFDVVFWDHGPEHAPEDALAAATEQLLRVTGKLLIYCAPWGRWPQGAEDGNQHEIHAVDLEPRHLENLAFDTIQTFGERHQENEGELAGLYWKS